MTSSLGLLLYMLGCGERSNSKRDQGQRLEAFVARCQGRECGTGACALRGKASAALTTRAAPPDNRLSFSFITKRPEFTQVRLLCPPQYHDVLKVVDTT